MADSAEWILKIISGPHQGAEVALRPGRVVVGSDNECDLVLHDVLVAARHFALSLDNGAVTVEPIDGPVFANGKRVGTPAPVPPFGFVTAGTTHLVLGPAGERWPLLSVADVPPIEKEPEPAAVSTEPSNATAAGPATDDKKNPKPPTPEQRRRAWWTAGIGAALLVVWVILWLTWAPRPKAAPVLSVRERAEQVLHAFPDAKAIKLDQQGDRLSASGYLNSDSAYREITAAFRENVPEVAVRIWSSPRILETARSVLATHKLTFDLSPGEGGELNVRGSVHSPDEWERTRQLLLAEVPGLQKLHEEITLVASAPARPSAAPAAVSPAAPPSASASPLIENLSVVALQELGDGQGWLRLSNGAVLFRGARLADGGSIVAFRQGQAIVENGGAHFALTVGVDLVSALRSPLPSSPTSAPALPATPPVVAKESNPQNG